VRRLLQERRLCSIYPQSALGAAAARAAGIPTLALLHEPKKTAGWPKGVAFVASLAEVERRIESKSPVHR
jgi:hypothetical protein